MKNSQLTLRPPSHSVELPHELEDAVRRRAYEIYQERAGGGMESSAEDDWLRAEAEVLTHQVRSKAA
jgi:Protein of unknown function (DUF2934)